MRASHPRLQAFRRGRTVTSAGWIATLGFVAAVIASFGSKAPSFLVNNSPSEPPGLYARSAAPLEPGAVIAFKTPSAAFPYADRRLAYLHTRPLLKAVVAGPGDAVCTAGDVLQVNGARLAGIASTDSEGRVLPRWRGCRSLTSDELFVFSGRIPNSFDSRYYGPVSRRAVLGVYTLVASAPWPAS